ncbi:MAG: S8 family serine peptidase [bacterium]
MLFSSHPDSMLSVIVHLDAQADIAAMDRQLYEAKASRALRHRVVVEALRGIAEQTQGGLLATLARFQGQGKVQGYTPLWITNCVVVKGKPGVFEELSDRDDIQWLERNFKPRLIEPVPGRGPERGRHLDANHGVPRGIRAVNAPRVWYELGITGAGRLVANLDTGVDGTHPALSARWRGRVAPANQCWHDPIYGYTFPRDLYGHGTHVMGTMCGNSTSTNDSVGVAPRALWIASNAIYQDVGVELNNDVLAAFQWFADPDGNPYTIEDVPDVIQNSWGVDGRWSGYEDCFNLWNNVIINCEAAGIVVVFSAGNEGPQPRTCRSPATVAIDSVTMFAVGAVDATNDTMPPYEIASWSSRGPSDCPPYTAIKPEVCAPGVDVYSSIPDGDYGWGSGTSMAGPHVAGIVALLREALPDANVRDIKSVLMRTAHDYGSVGEDNAYGFGFVDAYEAVLQIATNRGFLQGVVRDDNTSQPIAGATVQVAGNPHSVRTNAEGSYRISLVADSTWTIQYSAFGYYRQSYEISVPAGETLTQNVSLVRTPSGTLEGRVVAGDSVPIPGASVSFPGVPLPALQTDSLGGFQLSIPGDTTYAVRATYFDATYDTFVFVPSNVVTQVGLFLNSPRSLQTGPDAYGYFSFDRFDFGNPAPFDWLEISPSLGGNGTILSLQARDSSAFVAMPFPLYFYGQLFDSLTINENGWLSPGISHDHTFFNSTIPGWQGPSGTIAPFWDNLHDGADGEICYFYDSLNCRLIVEYNNMQYLPPGDQHLTFQVHIYSAEARATPTGDCEIVYIYHRLDIPDESTVGIESPSETMGLQLLYNGSHHANTWQIAPGAALRLTTRSAPDAYGTLTGQLVAHPAIPDLSQAVIRVGCGEVHPNESGYFIVHSLLTGLHRPEVFLDGYEVGRAAVAIRADSTSQVSFDIWRLDPPRELEATREEHRVFLQWRPPESMQGAAHGDAFLRYAIYRSGSLLATPIDTFHQDSLPGSGTYDYFVVAQYEGGVSDSSNHARIEYTSNTPDFGPSLPTHFELLPCFPNPFNPTTTIHFAVPNSSKIRILVYDILGREVARLADGIYPAGHHQLLWNAEAMGTGLYFVQLKADGFHQVRKVLLIR